MDHLPRNPHILASCINMLLRDGEYDTLSQICNAYGCSEQDLLTYLSIYGYTYSTEQRQIRPIGYDQ